MQPDRDFGTHLASRLRVVSLRHAVPARRPGRRFLMVCALLGSMLYLSLAGCSGGAYRVRDLPQEWHARPTSNVKTVGLTSLASDTVPVDQISEGDVLEVSIAAGLSSKDTVAISSRVNERGQILLPYIGSVSLEGLTLEQAESAIKIACIQQQIYRDPHVVVTMKQRKTLQVTVVGGVEKEGTYELAAGSSGLLQAISLAGGFSDNAGTTVEVRLPGASTESAQPGPIAQGDAAPGADPEHTLVGHEVPIRTSGARTLKIDLASLSETNPSQLMLEDGAVVMVERRDPLPLQVLGLVRKPDVYPFPVGKNLHVLDAVAMAGGTSSLVADKIYVIRRRPDQPEPALIQLSMRAAKRDGRENLLLEPGDTVSVEQTPGTILLETIRTIGFGIRGTLF